MNRKNIKLHPHVMELMKEYKDKIHDYASKRRVPMSWNEFFMIIYNDWCGGRTKCHCGHFYDCEHCALINNVQMKLVQDKINE